MSLISLKFWKKPGLALGTWTFQNNRLATYESLISMIDTKGLTTRARVQDIFEKWAMRDRARHETRHLVFSAIASRLARGGATIADAMRPFISDEEFLIFSAGEASGDFPKSLALVVRNIHANEGMMDDVTDALLQPAGGFATILFLSFWFGVSLWPEFLRNIHLKYWPEWTLPLIYFQIWFGKYWYSIVAALGLVVLYYRSRDRWTGRVRDWFDVLPPWSIHKGKQAASFLGVVSSLINSGRTVREAMVDIREKSSPYMRWHVGRIINRYDTSGKDGLVALRTGLFNVMILDRIEDASTGRDFGATLAYAGETSLKTVLRIVNKQAKMAGTVLLGIVGSLMIYLTLVTVFGVQDATDALIKAVGGSAM